MRLKSWQFCLCKTVSVGNCFQNVVYITNILCTVPFSLSQNTKSKDQNQQQISPTNKAWYQLNRLKFGLLLPCDQKRSIVSVVPCAWMQKLKILFLVLVGSVYLIAFIFRFCMKTNSEVKLDELRPSWFKALFNCPSESASKENEWWGAERCRWSL